MELQFCNSYVFNFIQGCKRILSVNASMELQFFNLDLKHHVRYVIGSWLTTKEYNRTTNLQASAMEKVNSPPWRGKKS